MNKQIEEMRKFVRKIPYLTLDQTTESLVAQYLVNEGYRKSTDVAAEVFEEIEKAFDPTISALFCISETLVDVSKSHIDEKDALNKIREYMSGTICSKYRLRKALAELKKKYESEGADDE